MPLGTTKKTGRLRDAILLAAAAMLSLSTCAVAGSLWARRDERAGNLFQDNVAARKGDTLTVMISEESSFAREGRRDSNKSTSSSASAGLQTTLDNTDDFSGAVSHSSDREFHGSDRRSGNRQFVDSITVTVIDVLPNGNMVLAGRSERHIADEEVTTILSGIVRPTDISGENAVASTDIANLQVYYETKDTAYVRDGWLSTLFNLVWPF